MSVFDWLFRNRLTGEITIGQAPNLPLYVFAGAALLTWIAPSGSSFETACRVGSRVALLWWAADEILRGVNPWRRLLGGAVLIAVVAAWLA